MILLQFFCYAYVFGFKSNIFQCLYFGITIFASSQRFFYTEIKQQKYIPQSRKLEITIKIGTYVYMYIDETYPNVFTYLFPISWRGNRTVAGGSYASERV